MGGVPDARRTCGRGTQTGPEGSSVESGMWEEHHQEYLEENWGQSWPPGLTPEVALQTTESLSLLLPSKDQCPSKEELPAEPAASRFRYDLTNWNDYRLPCCLPGRMI